MPMPRPAIRMKMWKRLAGRRRHLPAVTATSANPGCGEVDEPGARHHEAMHLGPENPRVEVVDHQQPGGVLEQLGVDPDVDVVALGGIELALGLVEQLV